MDQIVSNNIANLLNRRNNLPKKLVSLDIQDNNYFYISVNEGKKEQIVACARAKCMSFYAYEIKHVAVSEDFEGKGFGKYMIQMVEDYLREKKIPLAMATTRADNKPIIHLFTKLGYTPSKEFVNEGTKNPLILWQKFLT